MTLATGTLDVIKLTLLSNVHAFVTSWLDYCSTLYAGLPAVRLGCLEWVIPTATHLIRGIPRTGHISAYMLEVLHWLPLQQRIIFHIGALVWSCPFKGTGVTLCSFCQYFHNPGPCILSGWFHCVEWASFGTVIATQDSFQHFLFQPQNRSF